VSPYIGFGLGYARVEIEELGRTRNSVQILQFSGREAAFGYQGMVGVPKHDRSFGSKKFDFTLIVFES
jgi:opacity protein-like surface antigen